MNKHEVGHVILRVVVGITFFVHGLSKFQGGISNTVGFFESLGIPAFMAYVVAVIELVGGAALVIGLGTKVVGALFVIVMAGAIFTAKLPGGFLGNGQGAGYELDLLLLAASLYFVLAVPSNLSVDRFFLKKEA